MPSEEALLEACWTSPDDDAPRLVWADAVGGERGELVVIQCDLARGDLAPRAAASRRRRERALLRRHGREWSGLAAYQPRGLSSRAEFRRGFVEAAELDPRVFVEHGEDIFRCAPLLRSLSTVGLLVSSGDPLEPLRRLLGSAAFWRLHGLDLCHVGVQAPAFDYDPGFEGHGDEALRLLVSAGAIPFLDGLGVSWCGLTAAGVHQLVATAGLEQLERLWLRGNDLGVDAILALLARAPRLGSLDLDGAPELEDIIPALPPVTELHLSGISDRTLALLGQSRAAATLEKLYLSLGALDRGDGFRAFPRLRELDVRTTLFHDAEHGARDLAGLASLRRLRLMPSAPVAAIRIIAHELGPQLEELDVSNGSYGAGVIDALRAFVAGEVFDGPLDLSAPLL